MHAHTRAWIAACAYAVITGTKVAGIHDHATGQDLRIAAECRGDRLQGADGERAVSFGGTLPELYNGGDQSFVSMAVDGASVRGYDRGAQGHYLAQVSDRLVQLYDYDQAAWFAYQVQVVEDGAG